MTQGLTMNNQIFPNIEYFDTLDDTACHDYKDINVTLNDDNGGDYSSSIRITISISISSVSSALATA